ncbi:MAG TPA: hypothetical protein VFE47_12180 [Tepidisphaeraceae bacterium]|jgi:hypothetical protein|nr:hypothetical protein [Tepidisphaeraceae bacterium]
MVQQHIFDVAEYEPDLSTRQDAVLRFDAASAVRAIVFHLLDEGLAKSVSRDTIDRTIDRLKSTRIEPSIARRRWVTLSNTQRLRWILNECHTTMRVGENQVVRLRAKRSAAK